MAELFSAFDSACPAPKAPSAPATASLTPCPAPFPGVWQGVTYQSAVALKADLDAQLGLTTTYNAATCTFTAPQGTVFPALVVTAPIVVPPPVLPTKSCGVTSAAGTYSVVIPVGYIGVVDVAMPPDTAVSATTTVGGATVDYAPNGNCWCMSNVDTAPLAMGQNTIYTPGIYTITTFPARVGMDVCVTPIAMTPTEAAQQCPACECN